MPAGLNVLWASDGSESALAAIPLLRSLVAPAASRITVLTVAPTPMISGARLDPAYLRPRTKQQKAEAVEAALETARSSIERLGVTDVPVEAAGRFGHPIEQILKQADSYKADLIVIGAKGHSNIRMMVLGSVAQGIVEYAHRPTLLVRPGTTEAAAALIGIDDTPQTTKAVRFAAAFLPDDCEISLVSAVEFLPDRANRFTARNQVFLDEARSYNVERMKRAQKAVNSAQRILAGAGLTARTDVRDGKAQDVLLAAADEQKADLIVVGSRPPSRARHFLLSSVAESVARESSVSVLVVR